VFQAGGKGGGVYGFAPGDGVSDLGALLAFLNSNVADFLVKQTSSVYGGRFYSYADQFLRDLPVAGGLVDKSNKAAKRLSGIADSLSSIADKQNILKSKVELFPTSFERDLSSYELDVIGRLTKERPTSAVLSVEVDSILVEKALYTYEVRYGTQRPFEFEHREHAECLADAVRTRGRKTLALKEILSWHLPVKPEGCRKLLDLQESARRELTRLRGEVTSQEAELNELVYGLYGMTPQERKIIEAFLERYSSRSAADKHEDDLASEA